MRPSPSLVALLAAWGMLGIAASAGWTAAIVWQAAGVALAALCAVDAWLSRRDRAWPLIEREVPDALPIGVEHEVRLRIRSASRRTVDVHDLHPAGWRAEGLPQRMRLAPETATNLDYRVLPQTRGEAAFAGVQVLLHSPLRLWRRSAIVGAPRTVRVYPNFAPLARFAMFSAEQASRLVGAHLKRRRGEGTDFHQMREYRVGDSLRQIDWKATARARKLISREYQDEKNQQIIVAIDTGRRMLARDGDLAHFDRALDAAMVVSYLALRRGDAVGFFATGGAHRWVPPQRGMAAIDTLMRAGYDLQPQPVAIDYLAAATELSQRQRRRSLVMLVTNLRDEDAEDLLIAVRLLQRRHLVVVASLREDALDAALAQEADDLAGALRASATARYLAQRAAAHDTLRSQQVFVLDVSCKDLPAALVERYLAIKRDGLL
ncbi:MAG: DUF58 domain-containing protein [Luteimonas sp.]